MVDSRIIENNLETIAENIEQACQRSQRKSKDITLVAVSKKQPLEKMIAYQEICQKLGRKVVFGENYVQEFKEKKEKLSGIYESHLIGALQRNKAKDAFTGFDIIESVHSSALLLELEKVGKKLGLVKNIFLQVNISEDDGKSGFSVAEVKDIFGNEISKLSNLRVIGLMTVTKLYDNAKLVRPDFVAFRKLRDELNEIESGKKQSLSLSMGMSDDYIEAVEEGADFIRIGTALFGERN